ncbi:hypothetical protein YC2023_112940 [Brassica napus]
MFLEQRFTIDLMSLEISEDPGQSRFSSIRSPRCVDVAAYRGQVRVLMKGRVGDDRSRRDRFANL